MNKFIVEIFDDISGVEGKSANEAHLSRYGSLKKISDPRDYFNTNGANNDELVESITEKYFYGKGYYMFKLNNKKNLMLFNLFKSSNNVCKIIAKVNPLSYQINKANAIAFDNFRKDININVIQFCKIIKRFEIIESSYENFKGRKVDYSVSNISGFMDDYICKEDFDVHCIFDGLYV